MTTIQEIIEKAAREHNAHLMRVAEDCATKFLTAHGVWPAYVVIVNEIRGVSAHSEVFATDADPATFTGKGKQVQAIRFGLLNELPGAEA